MKGKLYYTQIDSKTGEEWAYEMPYGEKERDWNLQTKERAIAYITLDGTGKLVPYFGRFIDKAEFDKIRIATAKKRMIPMIEAEDLAAVRAWLSNNANTYSIKVWEEYTGVKLDKAWKRREMQLAEYYGEKWAAMLKSEQDKKETQKAAEAKKRAAEKAKRINYIMGRIADGKDISGAELVEACDAHGIEMHIRTRGYALHTIADINILKGGSHVYCKRGKKTPHSENIWDAVRELRHVVKSRPQQQNDISDDMPWWRKQEQQCEQLSLF